MFANGFKCVVVNVHSEVIRFIVAILRLWEIIAFLFNITEETVR